MDYYAKGIHMDLIPDVLGILGIISFIEEVLWHSYLCLLGEHYVCHDLEQVARSFQDDALQ